MKPIRILPLLLPLALVACSAPPVQPAGETAMNELELVSEIRVSEHRGGDDLVSAGLGLAGIAGPPSAIADPLRPTAAELRRRAIQSNWKGIADLGPLGGFGSVYGGVPEVPGREFSAFARLPEARAPFRVLAQVPDAFDQRQRCLVVTPSSGSRGVYGAIALAGPGALARGCAVVHTDKGTGSGYFDPADASGVGLDGRRIHRGEGLLEFDPGPLPADAGIGVKHLHSGDNPEADWGRHVLAAARFGLAMLGRAFPDAAPFTAANTRIIAAGLSNGGGAVLQAAGLDSDGLLDGVMAMEPNVHLAGHGRALYDYGTEAALLLPCALADARFDAAPFARVAGAVPPPWLARCARLVAAGVIDATGPEAAPAAALARLRAAGWEDKVLATAATTTAFDLWRAIAAGYASAYLRRGPDDMPCGFRYTGIDATGQPAAIDPAQKQAWWADAAGIPPGNGIGLAGGVEAAADPFWPGITCLRGLWDGEGADSAGLHAGVAALPVQLPRADLPVWVVHGADDGLIPAAFTSAPWVAWARAAGRTPRYWKVPHAQHFDAFLALPGFGDAHVPLLPYAYRALDALIEHAVSGAPLPDAPTPAPQPRGAGALTAATLDLGDG